MLEKQKINYQGKNWDIVTDVPNVIIKGTCNIHKDEKGRYTVSDITYIAGPKTREIVAIGYHNCNRMEKNKCYHNQKLLGMVQDIPNLCRHLIE